MYCKMPPVVVPLPSRIALVLSIATPVAPTFDEPGPPVLLPSEETVNVPPVTEVVPVYVFAPVNLRTPVPAFVRALPAPPLRTR